MPNVDDLYPSVWLRHGDLVEGDWTLTIKAIETAKLTNRRTNAEETQIVLLFEETELKLGLGKGNAIALRNIFGSAETEDWLYKKIVIGWAKTNAGVEYVQVREKPTEAANRKQKPKAAAPQPPRPTAPPAKKTAPAMTQEEVDAADDIPFSDDGEAWAPGRE
jgi:hypothetical protein